MNIRSKLTGALAALAVMAAGACDQEEPTGLAGNGAGMAAFDSTFASNSARRFDQVERLGNPLTMEVFVEKREHDAYDAYPARQDPDHFTDDVVAFVTTVAKREASYGAAIAGALLGTPANRGDKIAVFTTRASGVTAANMGTAANVGWLSHVLDATNGYGGRKLAGDDVVDKGLSVTFGNALGNNTNVSAGLVTDNVPANDKAPLTTFPYLPAPN